jgi:predicted glycosyltransferase involved in capsule biosynthesis
MGEDLELINRLAIAYNKFPLREDHLIDAPSKIPNRLKGFRRLFAHYALPHFEQQQFSIHIAHSTKLGSKYKKNQATNMDYFQKKMKAAIEGFELSPVEENSLGDKKYLHSAPPIVLSRMERWQKKMAETPKRSAIVF